MFDFNRNYTISRAKYVLLSKLRLATVSVAAHEGRHAGQPGGTWGHGRWPRCPACLPVRERGSAVWPHHQGRRMVEPGAHNCVRSTTWARLNPTTLTWGYTYTEPASHQSADEDH
jgi:hypothetical protein